MINHKHHVQNQANNFWFSFTLGTLFGAGGLFLIGTKQGRKLLVKLMEMSEDLEGSAEEFVATLQEKVGEKKIDDSLHSVMEKIKTVLPVKKTAEKPVTS